MMPEQKKVNHWKQGDYKHLTAGRVYNSRFRKYKESAHMACSTTHISQPSLDISPIWIPLISDKVTKSKRKSIP
jgi:hypothetical protein